MILEYVLPMVGGSHLLNCPAFLFTSDQVLIRGKSDTQLSKHCAGEAGSWGLSVAPEGPRSIQARGERPGWEGVLETLQSLLLLKPPLLILCPSSSQEAS